MIPTISTARLTLRVLTKPSPRQTGWMRDPDVVRYSEQRHDNHTLSSQLHYINSFGGPSYLWGIYLVENGEHIGNISATHDEPNKVTDVGILIGETKVWGRGFGAEAWQGACNWLLNRDYGNVRKLEAGCMRNNEAMVKIIQGSGFVQEGERLNHFLFAGNPISMLLFGRMQ